ncbi:hypothetical protein FACS1894161_2610 [Spirochaetia bacterium]|nr:hypothetical protein FACS1894161_2610 [Spirochaetia bacterium]
MNSILVNSILGKSITFDMRQKVIADSTSSGWKTPHVSYIYEADATGLILICLFCFMTKK